MRKAVPINNMTLEQVKKNGRKTKLPLRPLSVRKLTSCCCLLSTTMYRQRLSCQELALSATRPFEQGGRYAALVDLPS